MRSTLLGGLTAEAFTAKYWQKKPLLIRQAFPGFRDVISPDELAGLAMEDGVRARLVTKVRGRKPWLLETGPFRSERLQRLPRQDWSLLVQGVNEYVEAAATLIDEFNFVPAWRLDDLMVSFAPEGGGVGPHVDSYDVFIIQGLGRRRWQIAERFDPALLPGIDLKILKHFVPEQDWILEPGDMIYIPPGVAHCGVALEPCLNYSVGFRAPSAKTLIGSLLNFPDAVLPAADVLYRDPDLHPVAHPGAIGVDAIARLRAMIMPLLTNDELLARWFGAAVTSQEVPYAWVPESGHEATDRIRTRQRAAMETSLREWRELWRSDQFRFASYLGAEKLFVYVNAEEYALPRSARPWVELWLSKRNHPCKQLRAALPKSLAVRHAVLDFLAVMKAEGAIYTKARCR